MRMGGITFSCVACLAVPHLALYLIKNGTIFGRNTKRETVF